MRVIRLESDIDSVNYSSVYNKLFVFNPDTSSLDVFTNDKFVLLDEHDPMDVIREFNVPYFDGDFKLIINPKVRGAYSFPFKLFIDITDRCMLNCKHCLTKQLNKGNELPLNTILDIIAECSQRGVFYLKLGGGEPLLHPNIAQIIQEARKNNISVSLSTNSIKIDSTITQLLLDNNVKVSVSIEGPRIINDEIRGIGHFQKALEGVRLLKEAGCNVLLRATLTRKLLDEGAILEMINIAEKLCVPLKISYCRPAGNALDNKLLISFDDYKRYKKILMLLNSPQYQGQVLLDEGMMLEQPDSIRKVIHNSRICGAANRSLHINSKGQISPCVFLGQGFIEKESSYKYGDLAAYWQSKKGTQFQRIRSIKMPNQCELCSRLCKFECIATRYYTTGGFDGCDPNCLSNVLLKCQKHE